MPAITGPALLGFAIVVNAVVQLLTRDRFVARIEERARQLEWSGLPKLLPKNLERMVSVGSGLQIALGISIVDTALNPVAGATVSTYLARLSEWMSVAVDNCRGDIVAALLGVGLFFVTCFGLSRLFTVHLPFARREADESYRRGVAARRAFAHYVIAVACGVVLSLVVMTAGLTNGCTP